MIKKIWDTINHKFFDEAGTKLITGHVKIYEYEDRSQLGSDSGKLLLSQHNDIHKENASILLARAIANRDNGQIYTMHFGSGGATIDPAGMIQFASPNITGAADLHVPVYHEVVDDAQNAPLGNQMSVRHINGTTFSDVEIRCVLDRDEPYGQPSLSNTGNLNLNDSNFSFDEIGLKMADGLLVSHLIFTPILKASDRLIEVIYLLRIKVI